MFKSKWIAPHSVCENLHMLFSKKFNLGTFNSAVIRITADDYYKLYINGKYVGEGPAPSYVFRYRFNEYDITDYLHRGENEIVVRAYYQGLTNRVWVSGDNRAGVIADVIVDGEYLFGTDSSSWQYSKDTTFVGGDTVGYDTAFLENRDFTTIQPEPQPAKEVDCDYTFDTEPFAPVKVYNLAADIQQKGGRYFCDFGREYVGTLMIKATANADGKAIYIRCAEELDSDGRPRFDMRCGVRYEEKCTLKKGENTTEQYDYKAMRYVEIEADGGVTVDGVTLAVRHFEFDENVQNISTDNERLKVVFELCKDTVHYGVQDVFVDCPTREKGQYLGDTYIAAFAHYYLTNDCRLLKKALCDFADSIRYGGQFLSVAPCAYQQKIADYDLLYPHMLLKYYRLTGDSKTLKSLTPACEDILSEYEPFKNADGLLESVTSAWNLVDWPDNMRDGYEYSTGGSEEYGLHSVINAYYLFAVRSFEQICDLLGKTYKPQYNTLVAAFNRTFFDKNTGLYVDCKGGKHSSVHSNILPLAFGICSAEKRDIPLNFLLKKGMCCSVYMAYFYLKALCVCAHGDVALDMITSEGECCWLNMIKEGATATFEAWGKEQKWNTSLFHPWACAPILIINEHFGHLLY